MASIISCVFILALASQLASARRHHGNTEAHFTHDLLHAVTNEWTRRVVSPILYRNSLIEASLGTNDEALLTKTELELERAARVAGSRADRANGLEKSTRENHITKDFFLNRELYARSDFDAINSMKLRTDHMNFREPKAAVEHIKEYAANKTGNMIKRDRNIVIESDINEDTAMITLETLHMSHKWEQPFLFRNLSVDGKEGFLFTSGCFLNGYLQNLKAKAIVLPLNGTNARLLLLFADEKSNLAPLEKRLTSVDVTKIPKKLKMSPLFVELPETIVETVYSVRMDILKKLNIKRATSNQAELNNFFTRKTPVYIENFLQFSAIKITQTEFSFSSMTSVQYQKLNDLYASYSQGGHLLDLTEYKEKNSFIGKNPFFFYLIRGRHILAAGSSFIELTK